jgi:hypothetical protein
MTRSPREFRACELPAAGIECGDILRIKFLSCKIPSRESEPSAGGSTC